MSVNYICGFSFVLSGVIRDFLASQRAQHGNLSESSVWRCSAALKQTSQRKKPEQNVHIKVLGWIIIIFTTYIVVFISQTLCKQQLNKPFNIPIKQINKDYYLSILFGGEKKSFLVYNCKRRLFQNNDCNSCIWKPVSSSTCSNFLFQGPDESVRELAIVKVQSMLFLSGVVSSKSY